jgi:hypothetical protein
MIVMLIEKTTAIVFVGNKKACARWLKIMRVGAQISENRTLS